MQITRVELKNIKNHAEATFSFTPGVVAICGPNGAGKTSILEAIAWALFDHLEYNREDFVRRGAKRGQVEVQFISNKDGRAYDVHRDTGGGYYVYDPDTRTRLVEQKGQVVKWLREHIGVDETTDLSALFRTTIGVPQGTFTYDFTLQPANRKKVFDQILKVEEYRRAADGLRDTLKQIELRITDADRQLAEAEGELKIYDDTKAQHNELAARLERGEADYAAAQTARDESANEVARLDALKTELDAQRKAAERWQGKLEVTRSQLASISEALAQAQQAAAIVAAAQAGFEKYQAAAALAELEQQRLTRDGLRAQLSQTEHALIETQSQAQRCAEQLAEIDEARAALAQLAEVLDEQTRLEAQLAALRESRGERQSLERARLALDKDLEQMRQRYATLSKEVEKADGLRPLAESLVQLEPQRTKLDAQLKQYEVAINLGGQQRAILEKAQKELARIRQAIRHCEAEQARLAPLLAATKKLSSLEKTQQQHAQHIARLQAEIRRDEEMMHSLATGGICPLLSEKCLNLKPGESLETRFRSGLQERRAEVKRIEATLTDLNEQLQQARSAAAEIIQLPRLQAEQETLKHELIEQLAHIAKYEHELNKAEAFSVETYQQLSVQRLTLDQQIKEARAAERLVNQTEGLRGELNEIATQGKDKRAQKEQLTQRLAELSHTETQFAATEGALQKLNDPRSRAVALRQLIAREPALLKAQAANANKAAAIQSEQETLHTQLQPFATLDTQLAEANVARQNNANDYHAYLSNQKIAERLPAHETERAAIAAEIANLESSLAAAWQTVQALALRYDATAHEGAQHALAAARERVTQLVAQLAHIREQFTQAQVRLAQLEEVQQRRNALLATRTRAEDLRTTADFIRDILTKAAPYITEAYLYAISIEANQLYRDLTGHHDVTLRWATDYDILLEEAGRERPFLNLSGGEQMAAALAIRLAMLKELSEINLAFFDEPTTNMDEERRRNLAQQIGRIKDFQQLFVISHDDTFEGHTDQVILLGESNNSAEQ
jgi:exonuclease SbcC